MKKKIIVLSLGGSLIIPDKIDIEFLKKFKKIILKKEKNYKFNKMTFGVIKNFTTIRRIHD